VWFSLAGVAWSRGKQKRRVAGLWKQRGEKIEEAGVGMGEPRGEEQEGGFWSARGEEGPGRGTGPGATDVGGMPCGNRGGERH
jgi:hypothetical protein